MKCVRLMARSRVWRAAGIGALWMYSVSQVAPCLAAADVGPASGVLEVLAANRAQGVPNYVTVDVFLVAREDLLARTQKALERDTLGALKHWVLALAKPPGDANAPAGAAATTVDDFAAVLAVLAGAREPETLSGRAAAEYALIVKPGGLEVSPLWMSRIDYSQLVPRGYYAEDPELAGYFVLARYLGAVLFHTRVSEATGATESMVRAHMGALQEIARRLTNEADYIELLRPAAASGGQEDDLSLRDVWALSNATEPLALAEALHRRAAETNRRPSVLSGYVDRDRLRTGETASDVLTGVRLLPGVATWDGMLFQRLVTEAGAYTGKQLSLPFSAARSGAGIEKGYPLADELLAVLGSESAARRLRKSGDAAYADYAALLQNLKREHAAQPPAGDAALIATLVAGPEGAQDETARAAWTLARHRQLLHAKQSYTTVSRAMHVDAREAAAIEAAPAIFEALAADARSRAESVAGSVAEGWHRFAALAERCRDLAALSAAGKPFGADDVAFLNGLDKALQALGVAADRPVVVDVHTNPGERQIVQEATAWPRRVEQPCGETRCVGAKLAHREFKQPMGERLTDAQWRGQLKAEASTAERVPSQPKVP